MAHDVSSLTSDPWRGLKSCLCDQFTDEAGFWDVIIGLLPPAPNSFKPPGTVCATQLTGQPPSYHSVLGGHTESPVTLRHKPTLSSVINMSSSL